jgi:L-threonylcarbamoyladenylate synthase
MAKIIKVAQNSRPSQEELQEIAHAIKACKLIAFPTDTVYGIGANGLIKAAIRRIYMIKGREAVKALPILVKSTEDAKRWVEWTETAERLAQKFWPGPLTLVLRPTKEGRLLTFQEFQTLGIRVPAHPAILSVLEAAGVPLASSSANLSGEPSPKSCGPVTEALGNSVDFIIDAGEVEGLESSVVDATNEVPRVLREGKLSRQIILEACQGAAA